MRTTPLLAAALLAAHPSWGQIAGACKGRTLSELNRCIQENTLRAAPQAAPQPGEPAPNRAAGPRPAQLGGAMAPTDLRATPPVAAPRRDSVAVGPLAPLGPNPLDGVEGLEAPGEPLFGEEGRFGLDRAARVQPFTGWGGDYRQIAPGPFETR